jgi:hypothetical protein
MSILEEINSRRVRKGFEKILPKLAIEDPNSHQGRA